MKRFILSALLLAFTSIFVFGCSDSGDDSSSAPIPTATTVEPSAPAASVTAINLSNPDTLVGTYEITFFATNAVVAAITNNCALLSSDFPALKQCTNPSDDQVTMTGEATISKDSGGNYQIITKVQMAGGAFANNPVVQTSAPNDVYNYTVYTPIPASTIDTTPSTGGLNATGSVVKGTSGRNLTQKINGPNDEYVFKLQDDGTLLNEMTKADVPIVNTTDVRVIMKKKNDEVVALEENKPYTNPAITGFLPVAQ